LLLRRLPVSKRNARLRQRLNALRLYVLPQRRLQSWRLSVLQQKKLRLHELKPLEKLQKKRHVSSKSVLLLSWLPVSKHNVWLR